MKSSIAEELAHLNKPAIGARERDEIHHRIRSLGDSDPSALASELRSQDLDGEVGSLSYANLIEAIAPASDRWSDQLREEFSRVLASCRNDPNPHRISALGAFQFLERTESAELREHLIDGYLAGLASESTVLRLHSIAALQGFRISEIPTAPGGLRRALDDRDWRVRANAAWLLRDEQLLPEGYEPRVLDRVRMMFFPWRV